MKSIIKRLWKKFDKSLIAKPNFVNIVGPVDQKPTPYHDPKHRKIYPMKPSNSQWMFFYDLLHPLLLLMVN